MNSTFSGGYSRCFGELHFRSLRDRCLKWSPERVFVQEFVPTPADLLALDELSREDLERLWGWRWIRSKVRDPGSFWPDLGWSATVRLS